MLVESPSMQFASTSFNYGGTEGTAFEDFFNMEMLTASGSPQSSNSSSPRSPQTYPSMPLTPPAATEVPLFQNVSTEDSSFFNLYLDEEYATKTEPLSQFPPMPSTSSTYDFLGAFNALSSMSESSPSESNPESVAPQFAIDPQLVGTPSTQAMSDFGGDEEEPHLTDIEEVVEEQAAAPVPLVVVPVKVGGHGKARKGTVQSGGVTKKAAVSAAKEKETGAVSIAKKEKVQAPIDDDDLEDNWRPSPEEYKKMSSKEKRQLRNKISARNFRVRRKEYISTLEGDIAERDRLLDAIRSELGSSRSENSALRQEIDALKKALLAGRPSDGPVLPPPGPLPLRNPKPASTANLLTANTQKDLPSSPRVGARAFWGGFGGVSAGGITHVHTTIIPDLGLKTPVPALQENLNPALNAKAAPAPSPFTAAKPQGFDSFTEANPFTLKTMDAYRMQLWGKMAAQHQFQQEQQRAAQHQQQQYQQQQQQQLNGLASSLRPHYFTAPAKNISAAMSGKAAASSYPSPPTSPPMASKHQSRSIQATEQQQAAALAALASTTLISRLGSAFKDAFSGSTSSNQWDADKVRKVLEGKAVIRVVDVESSTPPRAPMPMRAPTMPSRSTSSPAVPRVAPSAVAEKKLEKATCCGTIVADLLAESMGSLSIKKV